MENQEYYNLMFILREPMDFICKEESLDWTHGKHSFELLVRNVAECQAVGLFKEHDTASVAFLFWSIVHGMASILIRRGSAIKKEIILILKV